MGWMRVLALVVALVGALASTVVGDTEGVSWAVVSSGNKSAAV
jgi:hypothetical protein